MADRIDTDAVLHKGMLAAGLDGEHVDLEGDLFQTTVEKQREDLDFLNWAHSLAGEARDHVLAEKLLPSVAHAAGKMAMGVAFIGAETIAKAFEVIHEGDERNDAIKREYGVGACALLCASALPDGFAATACEKFFDQGRVSPGAVAVRDAVLARPDGAALQEGMLANCKDGQRYALDRGITTSRDLAVTLKQNPEFAKRYEHDLAFKLGTDSIVWASAQGKLPAVERQLPPAPAPLAIEVRG